MRPNTSCQLCGTPIYRRPSQLAAGKGRYCSRACRNRAHPATGPRTPRIDPIGSVADQAPDVVGLTEAARLLGIRAARVRGYLDERNVPKQELAAGAVWAREAVDRVGQGLTSNRRPPNCVGLTEAAQMLGIQKSNVRKWMARRQLPACELTMGPVWHETQVLREKDRWRRAAA